MGKDRKIRNLNDTQVCLKDAELKRREDDNRSYLMELESEALLQNYYLEAGIGQVFGSKKMLHGGWEDPTCQLRGHFLGHYLSAAAMRYHECKDEELIAKANAIVSELHICQKENGDGVVLADYGITITTGTPAAGDKIIITETASSIKWVVRGHDHHVAANGHLEHTMTLETKFVYGTSAAYKSLVFDAPEAFYYAENGLAAGSYYFTVKNQAWYAADNDVPYYFTLANDVPAGGQLVINMTYNQSLQNKTVSVYASKTATSASETVSLSSTAIAGATNLGEPDGQTANMNFMHRIVFGSNNYAQSNIRQWLNATGKVNTYYAPQTKFDRPNGNLIGSDAAYAGFAHGLGDDFLNAVAVAVVPCRTNDVYEVDSLDGTHFTKSATYNLKDRFFLLSRPEIYGSWDSATYKDGELLDYYDGLTNAERIKYDSFGAARGAWLRSPSSSDGSVERLVYTDGSLVSYYASDALGAAVACIIA